MASNVIRSNHVGFTVLDLDGAVDMFQSLFGYHLESKGGRHPRGVELLTGVEGADIVVAHLSHPELIGIELISYRSPQDTRRVEARPCDAGFAHLTFDVRDIEAMVTDAAAFGLVPIGRVVGTSREAGKGQRVVYLRSPDGIAIELIQSAAQD